MSEFPDPKQNDLPGTDGRDPQAADLPHVESPDLAPQQEIPANEGEKAEGDPTAHAAAEIIPPKRAGTALVRAPAHIEAQANAPKAEPEMKAEPDRSTPRVRRTMRLRAVAGIVVVAALLGGVAGSLATTGIAQWMKPPPAPPPRDPALTSAVERLNHDLATLKTSVDGVAARAPAPQVAKIAERVERVEKAQTDNSGKLNKALDALDRVERRLAAAPAAAGPAPSSPSGAAAAQAEITGSTPDATLAPGPGLRAQEAKQPATGPIVDGWILHDVYRGAAMIQGRNGILEVVPGEFIPGLGRIEAIRRQDGHWVVMTSRGLIVER